MIMPVPHDAAMPASLSRPYSRPRSWLFTPATRPDRFAKARECGAHVLIVDLEDSVSAADKQRARDHARAWLAGEPAEARPASAVRINAPDSVAGHADIGMLIDAPRLPDFIVVPKVESPERITRLDALLRDAGRAPRFVATIESAAGVEQAGAIARASASIEALMFGAADYASDVAAQPDALALQIARVRIAAACAPCGVAALDAPCFALRDAAALDADLAFAVHNGFRGKAAIHPFHVAPINAAFTPSPQRIAWARRVIGVALQGAAAVDGRMVDEAIAREARDVLAAAR
ncbi:citrate lyase subunit beta [Burkholderia sp. MSMB2042]|nr:MULTISPECIES: aldolase/citrate lyase family protein [Burkholderia]AOJ71160.1 citrate lyase subunit beta [Burkholderia savannae]KVG48772.1 citrate lyase subunit beta [Burkholderia sp. MSMB0265]KVG86232.1 citrate lyase subunit beta [Burkholderia sp. MSMB2040]KVG90510.1 citrate lyase subunit beta [Burkholderia sp. MSMB2041]KVH00165.1 citrate lyase subunit beta [Burkholderia sp. MSMB2042]